MEKNFFDQPVKNNKVTFENIKKIANLVVGEMIIQLIACQAIFISKIIIK